MGKAHTFFNYPTKTTCCLSKINEDTGRCIGCGNIVAKDGRAIEKEEPTYRAHAKRAGIEVKFKCDKCGTEEAKHQARGLCPACYRKFSIMERKKAVYAK